jgi:hypothetical protein
MRQILELHARRFAITPLQQGFRCGETASGSSLHGGDPNLTHVRFGGHKRTFGSTKARSARAPKADTRQRDLKGPSRAYPRNEPLVTTG